MNGPPSGGTMRAGVNSSIGRGDATLVPALLRNFDHITMCRFDALGAQLARPGLNETNQAVIAGNIASYFVDHD